MMNNCWKMNGATTTYNDKKGWKNENSNSLQNYAKNAKNRNNQSSIFGGDEKPQSIYGKDVNNMKNTNSLKKHYDQPSRGTETIFEKCKQRLLARGGKGIIGLARQFKIFDDNNNKTLEYEEFLKACKNYKVDVSTNELKVLFNLFDTDGSGTVNYDEFLREIRGEMNTKRKNITLKAFKKIDKDGSGIIEINDIKALYNCKDHPDVKSGKKSEEDVYAEFLETFEMNHQSTKGLRDKKVSRDEFLEYYNNISASIDDDDYFEIMMNNTWKLTKQPGDTKKKAWSNDEDNQVNESSLQQNFKHRSKTPTKERETDRSTTPVKITNDRSITPDRAMKSGKLTKNKMLHNNGTPWGTDDNYTRFNKKGDSNDNNKTVIKGKDPNSGEVVIVKFRNKLASRGTRGIMGIRRSFMICDDDNSKTLSFSEFQKFCNDYRMGLDKTQVKNLFQYFDSDGSGEIDYEEFLHGVVGEMNSFRKGVVKRVFDKLDIDKSGTLEINDLRGIYNAAIHPDVKSGKKTEDDVLGEFLDTFEHHFSLLVILFLNLL